MFGRTRTRVFVALAVAATAVFAAALPAVASDDDGMGHAHGGMVIAPAGMKLAMTSKTTAKGVMLKLTPTKFRFAPTKIDGKHVPGQGHAHLYVDGKKLTVIAQAGYYYVGGLKNGKHTIQVRLTANDHNEYMRSGKPVAATVKVAFKKKA